MTLEELFLLLLCIAVGIVLIGTFVLMTLGFTAAQGAAITIAFMCFGVWNPVGWVVLAACIYMQVRERNAKMIAMQQARQQLPTVTVREG